MMFRESIRPSGFDSGPLRLSLVMAVRARPLLTVCLICSLAAFATGAILACAPRASAAARPPPTLRVNTTRDELLSHDGKCSLREAIAAVDSPGVATDCGTARRGADTIELIAGRYLLSIAPSGVDDHSTGDLNVTGPARPTITGAGTLATE